jgi:hypothetical protein
MLLEPRGDATDEDLYAWIDTRPVHRWQYATFLELAAFASRPVQLDPPLTLALRISSSRVVGQTCVVEICGNPFEANAGRSWRNSNGNQHGARGSARERRRGRVPEGDARRRAPKD